MSAEEKFAVVKTILNDADNGRYKGKVTLFKREDMYSYTLKTPQGVVKALTRDDEALDKLYFNGKLIATNNYLKNGWDKIASIAVDTLSYAYSEGVEEA